MIARFVFAGVGGQGVITAAVVLGEAAVIHEGLQAVQSQSYGAEARGGIARADLIVSHEEIRYPRVDQANVLVCLHQKAYGAYYTLIRPGGHLVVDSKLVQVHSYVDARQKSFPMVDTVTQRQGSATALNMCMLGVVVALSGTVRPASVEAAITDRFTGESATRNVDAFHLGLGLVEKHDERESNQISKQHAT